MPALSARAALPFAVANVYYALPLLEDMAGEFGMSHATVGIVTTVTQIGYGLGLVLVVPLGDLLNRHRLVGVQSLLSALALVAVAFAPTASVLLAGTLADLDLLVDYRTNPERYPRWHEYLRTHQPPTLIVWGRHDAIFPESGAHPYTRDLPDADLNLLDTSHFALEDHGDVIAAHIKRFAGQ